MARLFGVACLAVSADALRLEPMSRRAFAQSIAAAPLVGLTQAAFAERVSNAATDGVKAAPWMEAASSNVVLGVASSEKPAFKEFDSSLEGKLGLQDGKNVDESGAAYKSSSLTGSAGNAATLNGRKGGNLPTIRIAGKWADPGHPGCTRKVQLAGNKAFISGADEDGKPVRSQLLPCRLSHPVASSLSSLG